MTVTQEGNNQIVVSDGWSTDYITVHPDGSYTFQWNQLRISPTTKKKIISLAKRMAKKLNPSSLIGKWIPALAVKVNKNGTVSIKRKKGR